jgi:hypothetical protein
MRLETYDADVNATSAIYRNYTTSTDPSVASLEALETSESVHARMRSGTQSLERAICLMRELAARNRAGWRLGDLAARCG